MTFSNLLFIVVALIENWVEMDGWMKGGWVYGWMDDGWVYGWMKDGWVYGWMDDGWVYGWMDG